MALIIANGIIVTAGASFKGDILVRRGRIHRLGRNLTRNGSADRIIDATGKLVLPGAIDPHTHMDMPLGDIRSSDDFFTGTRAALFGGTTTIIDYANPEPGQSLQDAVQSWMDRAAPVAVSDFAFHVTVPDALPRYLDEFPDLVRTGITSIKCFFAYPDRFMLEDDAFLRVLERAAATGMLVNLHAENGRVVQHRTEQLLAAGKTDAAWHAAAHPREAEIESVARALTLLKLTGARLNIVHVSTREAVLMIEEARRRGQRVHGETCPQYLVLSDRLYRNGDAESARWVMSPPLRKPRDNSALWQALSEGHIQTVGTDHCPFFMAGQKDRGLDRFDRIPNGMPGVEDRLELLFSEGVRKHRITLNQMVRLTATWPARLYGLYPRKGDIIPGADADLVIFNPRHRHVISADSRHMNVDYSGYAGLTVTGKVEQVLLRGTPVVADGRLRASKGFGRFIPRKRPTTP